MLNSDGMYIYMFIRKGREKLRILLERNKEEIKDPASLCVSSKEALLRFCRLHLFRWVCRPRTPGPRARRFRSFSSEVIVSRPFQTSFSFFFDSQLVCATVTCSSSSLLISEQQKVLLKMTWNKMKRHTPFLVLLLPLLLVSRRKLRPDGGNNWLRKSNQSAPCRRRPSGNECVRPPSPESSIQI